jgi:uncharacterized protein
MIYSKYNINSRIKDSSDYYLVNILSGNADVLSEEENFLLNKFKEFGLDESDYSNELIQKGYFVKLEEEKKLYQKEYFDFIDNRDSDEIQIFFVTNYYCNFACSYCYQDEYENIKTELNNEIIDSFFSYINNEFKNRDKYITIFGGEPLLNNPRQKELIQYIIHKANLSGLDISIVSNGYYLEEYIDILKTGKIREVQVTLDGTKEVHDSRRFLKDKTGSFDKIVKGIDSAIQNEITINLRMVIDKSNVNDLPELAKFAIDKGWTASKFFKTQIGRNYELHHCQVANNKLFTRIDLYNDLYEIIKNNKFIEEFYKPGYSISKFLFENNELPKALFDSCPACKTEWAFDYTGKIYSCTATVGKSDEVLGTFYPEVYLNEDLVEEWQSRDVTEIKECKDCNVQLACGGGCGSVAKNNNGSICSTDCRPIKELLELGFAAYNESI